MDVPENVWAIGVDRRETIAHAPVIVGELGFAPLSVLDAHGERALPVFTTPAKAEQGMLRFASEEGGALLSTVLVGLEDLLGALREAPPGEPKVDYVGLDMGEGGAYPLIRP